MSDDRKSGSASETKQDDASEARIHNHNSARAVLDPTIQAAFTLTQYGKLFGSPDLGALVSSLSEQASACSEGDMKRTETMLTSQAHTLDAIFNNLARCAINADYVDHFDRYLKLALRAQSQCRATLEAISAIKNPPVMGYVRQANIAHGPQQVNNTSPPGSDSPVAGENPNAQNKLLEENDGERLDPGTTSAPGRVDPAMATVGKVHRPKNTGR